MELVKPSKPPICARSKTPQAAEVMSEDVQIGSGARQRQKSRRLIESEENEENTQPKVKVMK